MAQNEITKDAAKDGPEGVLKLVHHESYGDPRPLSDKRLQVLGYPARDVVSIDARGYVQHFRYIVVGMRMYQLGYVVARNGYDPTDANLARFQASFELTK